MSILTLAEAGKVAQNELFKGIALEIATTDELASVLAMVEVVGTDFNYIREGLAPTTQFINDAGDMGTPSNGTFDRVTAHLRTIASDIDVATIADLVSQGQAMGTQIVLKAKSTFELIKETLIKGKNTTSHTLYQATNPFNAIDAIQYGPWLDSGRMGPGELQYLQADNTWPSIRCG